MLEKPCLEQNLNRYLVIYDNYTAYYHSEIDFHLCLCQDFHRHLLNMDSFELQSHYQHTFRNPSLSRKPNWTIGTIIRVRKFGTQYHNARVIAKDCSIIKICFFERKSQTEMWIHSNSPIIDLSQDILAPKQIDSSKDIIITDIDLSRLRKRQINDNIINEGIPIKID